MFSKQIDKNSRKIKGTLKKIEKGEFLREDFERYKEILYLTLLYKTSLMNTI